MIDNQTPYKGTTPAPANTGNSGMPPAEHRGRNVSSVIGIIIIVFVLALGGFYVWGRRLAEETQLVPSNNSDTGENLPFDSAQDRPTPAPEGSPAEGTNAPEESAGVAPDTAPAQ